MTWFWLTLAAASFMATEDALVKKFFGHHDPLVMAAFPLAYSLPFLLVALPFTHVPAELSWKFWVNYLAVLTAMGLTFLPYYRAINLSPLSLSIPFLAFVPVFAFVFGLIFLGEQASGWGLAGIGLVVVGGYVLYLDRLREGGWLAPFRAIMAEPGSRLMIMTSAVWGLASVVGKAAMIHSSPWFIVVTLHLVLNPILLAVIILRRGVGVVGVLRKTPVTGLVTGAVFFGHVLFHSLAVVMVQTAYMLSVKRLNVLFILFYGWILFHERHLGQRLIGVVIMLFGVGLITWLGE
jgi:drug/metabolite transporter (DMT)-like permease